jgi:hypothetical protein
MWNINPIQINRSNIIHTDHAWKSGTGRGDQRRRKKRKE